MKEPPLKLKKLIRPYPTTRMEKIRKIPITTGRPEHKAIFNSAEKLLRVVEKANRQIIFIGQGMRCLFEATTGLNQVQRAVPRKKLRYLVTPTKKTRENRNKAVEIIRQQLIAKKIILKGEQTIYCIDVSSIEGRTANLLNEAIKQINPKIKIIHINQDKKSFAGGIQQSNITFRPTIKDHNGKLSAKPELAGRQEHLLFQNELKNYLRTKLEKAKQN